MNLIRLHITTEGETELNFVKDVLAEHLMINSGIHADARSVLTSKDKRFNRENRGGLSTYQKAKNDIITWMKEDNHPECYFTTMFDFYRLPNDFPGYSQVMRLSDPYEKVHCLEKHFQDDIHAYNFIPYIQLHEFEALIFADPAKLDWEYLEHDKQISSLKAMSDGKNPELINSGDETSPSKRILHLIPEYDKATAGVSVVKHIGMETLLNRCRHFSEWVNKLLSLGQS